MEERHQGPGPGESTVHTEMNINTREGENPSPAFADQELNRSDEIRAPQGPTSGPLRAIRARAQEIRDDAGAAISQRLDDVRGRVVPPAREAADRIRSATDRTNEATRSIAERYPLAVVAAPFIAGFALAGRPSKKTGLRARARLQIRGALMATLTGVAIKQAKDLLGLESGDVGVSRMFDEQRNRSRRSPTAQM